MLQSYLVRAVAVVPVSSSGVLAARGQPHEISADFFVFSCPIESNEFLLILQCNQLLVNYSSANLSLLGFEKENERFDRGFNTVFSEWRFERNRQLRNRDAAVRSRERKKMYVRDLELKSRYFEAECKRLGMMLQCSLAENHALKFSLQNSGAAFAAVATMQESDVLLLESLLLGSLLWFLGIKGLFMLTLLLLLLLPILKEAVPPQEDLVGGESRESPVPRKILNNIFGASIYRFSMMNKKWRGSRTRMKKTRALSVFKSLFMSIDLGSLCSGLVGGLVR